MTANDIDKEFPELIEKLPQIFINVKNRIFNSIITRRVMCIFFGNVSRQSRSIGINRDCENIFKQLGEMADTYIIFCYALELSEFYFLYNQQLSTDST